MSRVQSATVEIVWSVYIVRCGDGSLYTGIATDVARRLGEHKSGLVGAKYLRGREPLELALARQVGNRSLASKIEYRIKKLARPEKEKVLVSPERIDEMIRQCVSEL